MLTITDLFCGAGGSSTGAIQVPGVTVRIAANHWDLAVETHNTNHPDTDHATADIHQADPAYFPTTDILWASPECTKWSVAQGKAAANLDPGLWEDPESDEAAHRSRMLMYDVPRFAAHHRYRAVIVENVVDIATHERYTAAFAAWLHEMHKLGYQHREIYLNSMHAQAAGDPAPQSRDRIYIVFWLAGDRAPDLDRWTRPHAQCATHDQVQAIQAWKDDRKRRGRYRAQYVWRCPQIECRNSIIEPAWFPASTAIDWTIPGQRIGDRAKPLADKTMARIRAGLDKYGRAFQLEAGGNQYDSLDPKHPQHGQPGAYVRAWPLTDPLRTLHTSSTKALLVPVEGREGTQARPVREPMRTMTTRSETGIVITLRGHNAPKTTNHPLDTFAASGNHHGLLVPTGGSWNDDARTTDDPLRTRTTRESEGLLIPYRTGSAAVPTSRPMPTLTTVDPAAHLLTASAIEDCTFRMLEPAEIKRGMAFPDTYVMLGTRRQQVRLSGNAVTPPAARDLISAVAEALTGGYSA